MYEQIYERDGVQGDCTFLCCYHLCVCVCVCVYVCTFSILLRRNDDFKRPRLRNFADE